MRHKAHKNGALHFMVVIVLLTAMSVAGSFAPERSSWLQGSIIFKWALAILCSLVISYILVWLSDAPLDSSLKADNSLNMQNIKARSWVQHIQGTMVADLKRVLYFQPLIVLLAGWILEWGINKIVGIISFLTLLSICDSFFRSLRQWELNKKEEKPSVQT
jgi:hypothetical protein